MDYKLIYLARRNPVIPAADFGAAWLSHAAFANRFADSFSVHFKNARQCVKLHGADLPESFDNDHDGVALLAMQGWEGLQAARNHPIAFDELKRDEERVFAGHVDPWTMPAEEHIVVKLGGGRAFILSFLKPLPGITDEAFHARLAQAMAGLAALPIGMTRLVRNRVLERRDPPYDFAAIVELWFATEADAIAAAHDPAVIAALEQAEIADPAVGVRLATRLNLAGV